MSDQRGRLAVLLSGSGSNFQALLDAIAAGTLPAEVVVVASNRADAYGLARALQAGLPTLYHPLAPYRARGQSRSDYDSDLAQLLMVYRPDWIVMAGWMHLLSLDFLRHFPHRVVNLHPALPGQFPGTQAIARAHAAFQKGEIQETGVMVHLVPDERVDEGPLLGSVRVPIHPDESLAQLEARMHEAEHALLVQVLAELLAGRV